MRKTDTEMTTIETTTRPSLWRADGSGEVSSISLRLRDQPPVEIETVAISDELRKIANEREVEPPRNRRRFRAR